MTPFLFGLIMLILAFFSIIFLILEIHDRRVAEKDFDDLSEKYLILKKDFKELKEIYENLVENKKQIQEDKK